MTVQTMGNVYPLIVSSGATDLIRSPLILKATTTPDPIRIVLAQGAMVEGVTMSAGKPSRAWIYAVPDQPDGRHFQPVLSDGMKALAPATYWFFATINEEYLDLHDPQTMAKCRGLGRQTSARRQPVHHGRSFYEF